jgi:hypothetical protein
MITYSDMIEHALDYFGGGPADALTSKIRRGIITGYQRLTSNPHGWRYYIVSGRVNLNGAYSTGTIAYTASTRVLALTTGTWPTWAANGQVRIDSVIYDVDTRTDGSNLVLSASNCPAANISSGTTYTIFQSQYVAPQDFQDIYLTTSAGSWDQLYIDPEQWFSRQRNFYSAGTPYCWTIAGSTNPRYGKKAIWVDPAPSADSQQVFLYRRTPRRLTYTGQETATTVGTVTLTAGSTAVTGTSTTFHARMVGSVLRVSDSTATAPDGLGGANPYTEEFVIKSVTNTTALVLAAAPEASYTGVKYRISDPIDIDDCMISPMRRAVEFEIESIRNVSEAALGRAERLYRNELVQAWAIDGQSGIARAGVPLIGDCYDEPYTVNTDES